MPLLPTQGNQVMREAPVAAAETFKRGVLLSTNTNGELIAHPLTAGVKIAGISAAGATKTINGKLTYFMPASDEDYLVNCTPGSTYTRGQQVGFANDVPVSTATGAATTFGVSSTATVKTFAVVTKTEKEIEGQSVTSRIAVRLVRSNMLFN